MAAFIYEESIPVFRDLLSLHRPAILFLLIVVVCFVALMGSPIYLFLWKNKKKKFILPIFIFFVTILFVGRLELYFAPNPFVETVFKPEFSWEGWRQIEPGMSKKRVEDLIGTPYKDRFTMIPDTNKEKECLLYSEENEVFPFDFAWIGVNVCFDKDEIVTRTRFSVINN